MTTLLLACLIAQPAIHTITNTGVVTITVSPAVVAVTNLVTSIDWKARCAELEAQVYNLKQEAMKLEWKVRELENPVIVAANDGPVVFTVMVTPTQKASVHDLFKVFSASAILDSVSVSASEASTYFPVSHLAYPQYADSFKIPKRVWEAVRWKATQGLADSPYAHPDVLAHWRSITKGVVPFGLQVQGGGK